VASTAPALPGASAVLALIAVMAVAIVDSRRFVRVAGSPSFDRLRHRITLSFHSVPGSVNWMPGKGMP
jgi:hypothetical protein